MLDVAELFHAEEAVDGDGVRVADAVDVVAGEVDEHDVLGAVLERRPQLVAQPAVLLRRGAPLDRPRDGVGDDASAFALDEELGRGANDLEIAAVDVEEVRGGVDGAEVAVDVEGVEVGGSGEALRGHRLEDVAAEDVRLEAGDVRLVPLLANVGGGLAAELHGALRGHGHLGLVEHLDELVDGGHGVLVGGLEGGGVTAAAGGHLDVADDLDDAVEAVKGDNGVKEHKQRLGDLQDVLERARRLGLKVPDAVVANVANGAARQRGELQAGDVGDDVLGELLLEERHGVGRGAMAGTGGDDLARVGADEAVPANLLGGGGFEEERVR